MFASLSEHDGANFTPKLLHASAQLFREWKQPDLAAGKCRQIDIADLRHTDVCSSLDNRGFPRGAETGLS